MSSLRDSVFAIEHLFATAIFRHYGALPTFRITDISFIPKMNNPTKSRRDVSPTNNQPLQFRNDLEFGI